MAVNTFDAGLVFDPATGRGVSATVAKVTDPDTGLEVDTFELDGVTPKLVITDRRGYFEQFTANDVAALRLRFGTVELDVYSNLLTASGVARNAVDETITGAWDFTQTPTVNGVPIGGGADAEGVRDTMAAALVAGSGISITPDDAADTITITATGGGAGTASPLDIHVGAPTGTNDHTLINAAIATAKTAGQPARLIFSPGTYVCSAPLTSLADTSMITFVGPGARRPLDIGAHVTTIRWEGTGAGTFIDAAGSTGFTVSGLAIVYSSSSFTGTLIDVSGGATPPSYSPRFENCFLGTTYDAGVKNTSATILNLSKVVEAVIDDCAINGGAVGIDGTGDYSNAVTMTGGRFGDMSVAAVKNPRFQWTFNGVVFEPGCVVKSDGQASEGLAFHGCGWWDSVASPFAWIDIQGSGLSITGGYWEPQGGAGESLVKLHGAFDGVSITGLKGHGMNGSDGSTVLALAGGASVTNLNYGGNSLTNCVDGIAAAQAVGSVVHSESRATGEHRDLGSSGAAVTLPLVKFAELTLTANCTLTLPTVPAGYEHRVRLMVHQDATGSRTITWPSTVRWPGGTAPTLTATAGRADCFELWTVDGGANWYGRTVGLNFTVTAPAASYADEVLADAPALYWRLGESSGTTAFDDSGNLRPGEYGSSGITLGTAGLVPDADLCPTLAEVTGQKVVRTFYESWQGTYPQTIECLFRQTSSSAGVEHTIIARHGDTMAFDVMVVDGSLLARVRPGQAAFQTCSPAPAITLDTTYHLAFVLTASGCTLYLNGSSVATTTGAPDAASSVLLTVGSKQVAGYHGPFAGKIDEVAVYSSALSAARILAHAEAAGVV